METPIIVEAKPPKLQTIQVTAEVYALVRRLQAVLAASCTPGARMSLGATVGWAAEHGLKRLEGTD